MFHFNDQKFTFVNIYNAIIGILSDILKMESKLNYMYMFTKIVLLKNFHKHLKFIFLNKTIRKLSECLQTFFSSGTKKKMLLVITIDQNDLQHTFK